MQGYTGVSTVKCLIKKGSFLHMFFFTAHCTQMTLITVTQITWCLNYPGFNEHIPHARAPLYLLIIGCQLSYLSLETYYGSSVNIISLVPLYHHCLGHCWHGMNITAKLSNSCSAIMALKWNSRLLCSLLHVCEACKYECTYLCI